MFIWMYDSPQIIPHVRLCLIDMVTIYFRYMKESSINILINISFLVLRKKVSPTGWGRFWGELSL